MAGLGWVGRRGVVVLPAGSGFSGVLESWAVREGCVGQVVAQHLGVPVAGSLLAPAMDLDDGGVQVDRHRRRQVRRARTAGPQPAQQLAGHRIQLSHVVPLEAAQPRPDRRRRPGRVEQPAGGPGAQQPGVIDAVPTSEPRTVPGAFGRASCAQKEAPSDDTAGSRSSESACQRPVPFMTLASSHSLREPTLVLG